MRLMPGMDSRKTPGGTIRKTRHGNRRIHSGKRKAMVGPSKRLTGGGSKRPTGEESKRPRGIKINGTLAKQAEMTCTATGIWTTPTGMMQLDAETTSTRELYQVHSSSPQMEVPLTQGPWPTRKAPRKTHPTPVLLPVYWLASAATRSMNIRTWSPWSPMRKPSSLLKVLSGDENARPGTAYIGSSHMKKTSESVMPWNGCMAIPAVSRFSE